MSKKRQQVDASLFPNSADLLAMWEGYYAGDQPNPNLRAFVDEHVPSLDAETDPYAVPAFGQPIHASKATAVYNMHTYWSKKPHGAIRQYVRHYTKPGDLILDPFCGSGSTAFAALTENRNVIAIDRSPAATFITKNYCTPVDVSELRQCFQEVLRLTQPEIDWLHETRCDRCGGPATTAYTVYSQVFRCPRCLSKVALYDCSATDEQDGESGQTNACPHCLAKGNAEPIRTRGEKHGAIPVLVSYLCKNGCKPVRGERRHNDADQRKRRFFEDHDLAKLKEIESKGIPHWYPTATFPKGLITRQPVATGARSVDALWTKRNLWALAAFRHQAASQPPAMRDALLFVLTSCAYNVSRMVRESNTQYMPGYYYLPPLSKEVNVLSSLEGKFENFCNLQQSLATDVSSTGLLISTQSACDLNQMPSNSVDYVFTDPPYSGKVQYAEANFGWEQWLGFRVDWWEDEIIVNGPRRKGEGSWQEMMLEAFREVYRVLRPGRWASVCYHDASEGSWAALQDIMTQAGFIPDTLEEAVYLEYNQLSYKQYTSDTVTKRDLVINFRKPKAGDSLFPTTVLDEVDQRTFAEKVKAVIAERLQSAPGLTKDRIYDDLVSRMVRKRQMEAHDFSLLLRTVAEEADGRWYLRDSVDSVDQAEQAKEGAAAKRLEQFIAECLEKRPEHEGVHYSTLFEQYFPVHDKPRRLLADWLPEHLVKTPSGTWRPPTDEERKALVTLREAGTLRRIKCFAASLMAGALLREKDRPAGDVDLLDWLRQCRRAGLYEQGRVIFEKGGLNLANLSEEEQIDAEDSYRICVRRGSNEEANPKRQRRKTKGDK